jgi:hypothetical protein
MHGAVGGDDKSVGDARLDVLMVISAATHQRADVTQLQELLRAVAERARFTVAVGGTCQPLSFTLPPGPAGSRTALHARAQWPFRCSYFLPLALLPAGGDQRLATVACRWRIGVGTRCESNLLDPLSSLLPHSSPPQGPACC